MPNRHELFDGMEKLFSSTDECEDLSDDVTIEFTPEDDDVDELAEETTWEWDGSSWQQVN